MNLLDQNMLLVGMVTVLAVVSPGPDFAVIVRNGLRYDRQRGLATALGIACGVVVHTTYALLGLSYVVAKYAWVLEAVRYAGAVYLLWLGVSAFLPRKGQAEQADCVEESDSVSVCGAFRHGFFCNLLNPKTMLFFIALFTQVISPTTSLTAKVGIGAFISLTHLSWFAFVVFVLTDPRTVKLFDRWRHRLEKVVGACLFGLGAKLALDS
ncbi:LysE family translocator [Pseudodesulfovibrio cashew]|uniref:LysE family translocator n=1 Tax=Pseudodesulfovibrio cashew TaxID=2678688 RepID=A0A6I6JP68_9BACT|nr:LysE family transporter [Pseudodesulfovibrio cashew]QGY41843.1 LysE family translocator [Pseudodesulfovibrio cashew]